MKIYNDNMKISKPFGRIENAGCPDGDVVTPYGIVGVYVYKDLAGHYHSKLDFAFKGRLYLRAFQNKRYSPRGLVTKANRFAEEITKEVRKWST